MYYSPIDIDRISDKMKSRNCWALWKEETADGCRQKTLYNTRTQKADVNKPETFICFYEALIMLLRYPEFQGLCLLGSVDLESIFRLDHPNKEIEISFLKFYLIKNPMKFLKSENSLFRGSCQ